MTWTKPLVLSESNVDMSIHRIGVLVEAADEDAVNVSFFRDGKLKIGPAKLPIPQGSNGFAPVMAMLIPKAQNNRSEQAENKIIMNNDPPLLSKPNTMPADDKVAFFEDKAIQGTISYSNCSKSLKSRLIRSNFAFARSPFKDRVLP